jgi:hypothetical protein
MWTLPFVLLDQMTGDSEKQCSARTGRAVNRDDHQCARIRVQADSLHSDEEVESGCPRCNADEPPRLPESWRSNVR